MENKLRWGILSTARIGLKAVIPAIQRSNNGVVTALASRNLETAQTVAQAHDIPHAYGSYEELIESDMVDAVYIPLPNNLHREWAIRAAETGKHILCEKPFALNAGEVDEMIAAARENRVLLMEAFMYRFHPQFTKLRALLDDGAIGALRMIRSAFCFSVQDPSNIRMVPELGGGSLMDVGCYCVDMARYVARAEPVEVQAMQSLASSDVDDAMVAVLQFPDGVVAHFDCSFKSDYREWLEIQGTERRIDLPRPIKPGTRAGEIYIRYDEAADVNPRSALITAPAANHYRLMVQQFADAVIGRKELPFPPEYGRANMRVIDALYESARTGRTVRI